MFKLVEHIIKVIPNKLTLNGDDFLLGLKKLKLMTE